MNIINVIHAEWKKKYKTNGLLLGLAVLAPVLIQWAIYLSKWDAVKVDLSTDGWMMHVGVLHTMVTQLLYPIVCIVLVFSDIQQENKADSWKVMYVLPIRKLYIALGKMIFLFAQAFVLLFAYAGLQVLSGFVVSGYLQPSDQWSDASLMQALEYMQLPRIGLYLCSLISLHLCLELFQRKGMAVLMLGLLSMVLLAPFSAYWSGFKWIPYTMISSMRLIEGDSSQLLSMDLAAWGYLLVFTGISCWWFDRRDL